MNTRIRRLLSAFAIFGSDPAAEVRSPREARTHIEKLRARLERQSVSNRRARTAVTELQARLATATARLDERRRTSLTPDVLAVLLPIKAANWFVTADDSAPAIARDARMLTVSAAYRAAIGNEPARLRQLQRLEIAGMSWWIPVDAAAADRATRAVAQGFPLRAILQTRELSIGGVMLDLGANIGRTSIPRVLLGDVRAVYAAEPEPANFACLVQNVIEHSLRGFVLPDQVAIGAESGEITLRQSRYMGGHRVLHLPGRKPVRTVTVPLTTVDDWIATIGVVPETVSFVKVDTQGSEVAVLRGAASLLDRRRAAWQIEIDPALLQGAGVDVRTLVGLIETRFTHFIDLGTGGRGPRVRPVSLLAEALDYLGVRAAKTDVIVYNAAR